MLARADSAMGFPSFPSHEHMRGPRCAPAAGRGSPRLRSFLSTGKGLTDSWEQWGWLHIRGHSIEDESVLGPVYGVNVATGARYSEHVNALHDLLRADAVQLRYSLVVVGSVEEFTRTDRERN